MTLYEITGRYRDLMWLADDPEADPEAVQTCMEELDDDLATKADGYVTVIKSLEGDNETDRKEIKRLQDIVDSFMTEVDSALSVSNALTTIDVEYETL